MNYTIECEQEVDGRWLAEVKELPDVLNYRTIKKEANQSTARSAIFNRR